MYSYTVMPLFTEHIDEICEDIKEQYEKGIADCAIFKMTLTPEGNPPLDKAKIFGEQYKLFSDKLAQMGLECGILVQATMGHGYLLNKMFEFEQYTNLSNGYKTTSCCPLDENFRKHFKNQMATLASYNPKCIMVDDDFRLMDRGGLGCTCDLHMKKFNKLAKVNFSREQLREYIVNDVDDSLGYKEIFIETQRDALVGAAKAMREGIDSVNPHILGIYCTCGDDCEFADEIAEALKGKNNPLIIRLNNGFYGKRTLHELSNVMKRVVKQKIKLKNADALLAETDTCPQNRYSKGAQTLHAHYILSILAGVSGAKHWITRLMDYEPKSGIAYRKKLGDNKGMYEKLEELTSHLTPFGCCIPISAKKKYYFENMPEWKSDCSWSDCLLDRMGLPVYYSDKFSNAIFMTKVDSKQFDDNEIKEMLRSTLFISSDCAIDLIDRGFGDYIGVDIKEWNGPNMSHERILLNNKICRPQIDSKELVPKSEDVKTLSVIEHLKDGKENIPLCPGVTSFKNELGGTVNIFAGTPAIPFNYADSFSFFNESRKEQLISMLQESGNCPVCYTSDEDVFMHAGYLNDGTILCALFNLGFDAADEIHLFSEKYLNKVQCIEPDGSFKTLDFKIEGNNVIVKKELVVLAPVILILS